MLWCEQKCSHPELLIMSISDDEIVLTIVICLDSPLDLAIIYQFSHVEWNSIFFQMKNQVKCFEIK